MLKVHLQKNENLPKLLKRFKKMYEKEGIARDLKRHEYYESPSQRRRLKKNIARRKRQRASAEINQ